MRVSVERAVEIAKIRTEHGWPYAPTWLDPKGRLHVHRDVLSDPKNITHSRYVHNGHRPQGMGLLRVTTPAPGRDLSVGGPIQTPQQKKTLIKIVHLTWPRTLCAQDIWINASDVDDPISAMVHAIEEA